MAREEKIEVPFEIPYNWIWSKLLTRIVKHIKIRQNTNLQMIWVYMECEDTVMYSNLRYDLKIQRFKSTKKFISNKGIILTWF